MKARALNFCLLAAIISFTFPLHAHVQIQIQNHVCTQTALLGVCRAVSHSYT